MFNRETGTNTPKQTHQESVEGHLMRGLLDKTATWNKNNPEQMLNQMIQPYVYPYAELRATAEVAKDTFPTIPFVTGLEKYYMGIKDVTFEEIVRAEKALGIFILDNLKRSFPDYTTRKKIMNVLLGEAPVTTEMAYVLDPFFGAIIATMKTFPYRNRNQRQPEPFFINGDYLLDQHRKFADRIAVITERDRPSMKVEGGKLVLEGSLFSKALTKDITGSEETIIPQELGKLAHPFCRASRYYYSKLPNGYTA